MPSLPSLRMFVTVRERVGEQGPGNEFQWKGATTHDLKGLWLPGHFLIETSQKSNVATNHVL